MSSSALLGRNRRTVVVDRAVVQSLGDVVTGSQRERGGAVIEDSERLIVLRHGFAGTKLVDAARDFERPLDVDGRAAAQALPDVLLGRVTPSAVVSSPFLRCTQTVAPLARRLGLDVVERHELAAASSALGCAALLRSLPDRALVCTHGELIRRVFELECEKGGFWIFRRENGELHPIEYVARVAADEMESVPGASAARP